MSIDKVLEDDLIEKLGLGIPEEERAGSITERLNKGAAGTALPQGVTTIEMPSVPGYERLAMILGDAYLQAATGKGKERHANGPLGFVPWVNQPILSNARQTGPGSMAYQVMKKAQESTQMAERKDFQKAMAEALGSIVYAAALYQLYMEMEAAYLQTK